MKNAEAKKLLEQSYALRPCSTCRDWSWQTDARCPDCKTSPNARVSIQKRAYPAETRTSSKPISMFCVCPNCRQLFSFGQIHDAGTSECQKCHQGKCVEVGTPNIPPPHVGANLLCMVCAFYKPYGIFSSKTGEAVCVECRDNARRPIESAA